MRIIAGFAKKRKLFTEPRQRRSLRYSSDKTKGAIFNILGATVVCARVLDLYAGSGNLGLEALSRGAAGVTFVEKRFDAVNLIKRNAALLGVAEKITVLRGDVQTVVERLAHQGQAFDLVLADPPYREGLCRKLVILLSGNSVLKPEGFLVCEHDKREVLPEQFETLALVKHRVFGDTALSIYQYRPGAA